MKTFFVDTNFFLRIWINNVPAQTQKAEAILNQAKKNEVRLVVVPFIVLELEFVLRKYYRTDKKEISELLNSLVQSQYLEVRDRMTLLRALSLFDQKSVDLTDVLLLASANAESATALSFDKDFEKFQKPNAE